MSEYRLMIPNMEYAEEIMEFKKELVESGSDMNGVGPLKRTDDPAVFVRDVNDDLHMETLKSGRVLCSTLLCIRKEDNKLVGMIQIRHYLNEFLTHFGGHIGYCVLPSERNKGIGKKMLSLGLEYCKQLEIERVLITCVRDNIASEKVIIGCGGEYESTIYLPTENLYLKRFWIDIK